MMYDLEHYLYCIEIEHIPSDDYHSISMFNFLAEILKPDWCVNFSTDCLMILSPGILKPILTY